MFTDKAVFEQATFVGEASFGSATFEDKETNFWGATFTSEAEAVFRCATFTGPAYFFDADLGTMDIKYATFKGDFAINANTKLSQVN